MLKLIFANQKGGVAKTSTALNLAYEFARSNKRVLFIDLDPQASASSSVFGNTEFEEKNIYHVLTGPLAIPDIVVHSDSFGFDIAPSNILLSGFMFPFRGMPQWAQVIGEILPLTHFMRIVRGIMLKGNGLADMKLDVLALVLFLLAAMGLALLRFRRTLD